MNSAAWGKLAALRAELCGLGSAAIGFAYVSLDPQGYRTGSMNEPLLSASGPAGHATTRTP